MSTLLRSYTSGLYRLLGFLSLLGLTLTGTELGGEDGEGVIGGGDGVGCDSVAGGESSGERIILCQILEVHDLLMHMKLLSGLQKIRNQNIRLIINR